VPISNVEHSINESFFYEEILPLLQTYSIQKHLQLFLLPTFMTSLDIHEEHNL
jgi:hypothetical protein